MLSSNQPLGRSAYSGKSLMPNGLANTQTIDNMKVRNQMRRTNRAMMTGSSESLAKSVSASGMKKPVVPIQKNPVVRQRTARDFA